MTVTTPPAPNLLSPEHVADPWPGLAILRDHYPVHFDETMECWLVSRYEDIRPINHISPPGEMVQEMSGKFFADATTFMAMDGPPHRKRRSLLAPFFARSGVEGFRETIERRAHTLLDPIFERERQAVASGERQRGEMDWVNEFTSLFAVEVMIDMMGLPFEDLERFKRWVRAWVAADLNIALDPEISARAQVVKDESGEYLLPLIAERRTSEANDFISFLCRAELEGAPVSDEEIRSMVALMMLGGGDTTAHQLSWLVHELVLHPDQQEAFTQDRDLMPRLLAEGMRHASIVAYVPAVPPRDVEVGGVTIEAGTMIALVVPAGNRDPRRFADPEEFNIFRDDLDPAKAFTGAADHLGFGGGPHFCIGSQLTKAEQEIALNVFFDNVRNVRFADGFEPAVDVDNPFIRSLPSLKITFDLV